MICLMKMILLKMEKKMADVIEETAVEEVEETVVEETSFST
mgnify:CR=1 FL=1